MNSRFQKALREAVKIYTSPKSCFDYMVEILWPKGVTWPRCASERVTLFANRAILKCTACKKQFSVKVGTIFEDSRSVWKISSIRLGFWRTARNAFLPAKWLLICASRKDGMVHDSPHSPCFEAEQYREMDGSV